MLYRWLAPLAQFVKRLLRDLEVVGSVPGRVIPKTLKSMKSLHSMGSAVVEVFAHKAPLMKDIVREKVRNLESMNSDDSFFIVDLGEISRKLDDWRRWMPRVAPFYAMKCNPEPEVVRFIADLGASFDCASKKEIEQVLSLGVHSSRIVYANPCKTPSHLRYAANKHVNLMTFDSTHELVKIKKYCPQAKLILRIHSSKEFNAVHMFDKKFGCHPKAARSLLTCAKDLELSVVGVSFHVGSLPSDVQCFSWVIEDAHYVYSMAEDMGFNMKILDIGGGFPGKEGEGIPFSKIAPVINKALDEFFPPSRGTRIIAEPGRYFVTSAFTLAVNVIAKRLTNQKNEHEEIERLTSKIHVHDEIYDDQCDVTVSVIEMDSRITDIKNDHNDQLSHSNLSPSTDHTDQIMGVDTPSSDREEVVYNYFLADGIYGSFNNVFTDHATVTPLLIADPMSPTHRSSILWGPTCDGADCVVADCQLPELDIGQWLYFHHMGAYTLSLASDFNGVLRPRCFYMCTQDIWDKVYPVNKSHVKSESKTSNTFVPDVGEPEMIIKPVQRQRALSYRLSLNKGE